MLEARGLRLAFGGVRAADGIDLSVMRGEFLAIIGPNGAGTTTFINMTTGYLRPQAGSIHHEGERITGLSPRAIVRRGIARSFQLPQLFTEHTVLENAALAIAARLAFLDTPAGPIASFVTLEWDDTVGLYNSGFRPDCASLSPGLVLLAGVVRDALERGRRRFDFLRGEERYKYEFGPVPEAVHAVTIQGRP